MQLVSHVEDVDACEEHVFIATAFTPLPCPCSSHLQCYLFSSVVLEWVVELALEMSPFSMSYMMKLGGTLIVLLKAPKKKIVH